MAYSMYNNNSNSGKRGYFYDVRNLPYGYYGMHPMDVMEYQRGRPAKQPLRLLNRQYKRTVVQLSEEQKPMLVISVQVAANGQSAPCMVLSSTNTVGSCDSSDDGKAPEGSVSIPESLAPQMVQQLRKLTKWKAPANAAGLPSSGQGLTFEDSVFKLQVVNLNASVPTSPPQYAVKILAESRARDPLERKELSSVIVPMEPVNLIKLRSALADLVVTESPLYHTESLQGSDGSKFYLDLIRDESAHYLKVSHVTRDFRSIVIVPSSDVEALRDLLDTSLKAMKACPPSSLDSKASAATAGGAAAAAAKRKRGRNNPRRRPVGQKRRGGGGSGEEKENSSDANAAVLEDAANGDAKQPVQQSQSSEDNSTVESRPVENGDGPGSERLTTTSE